MAMELSFWNDFLCRNALTANDPCGPGTISLRWINRKSLSQSCKSNCNTSTKIKFVKAISRQPSVLLPRRLAQRFRPFFALGRFSKDLRTCRMDPLMRFSLLLAF